MILMNNDYLNDFDLQVLPVLNNVIGIFFLYLFAFQLLILIHIYFKSVLDCKLCDVI